MRKHYPFLLIFFAITGRPSTAQTLSPDLTLAYHYLLEYRTDSATRLAARHYTRDHDLAFRIYISSLQDLLNLLLESNDSLYQLYDDNEKEYFDVLESLSSGDEFVSFVKGETRLHSAIIRFRYRDNFTGALRLIQAYRLVNSLLKDPEPPDYIYKTAGVLNIILSIVPDRYEFLMRIIGVKSDLSTGIQQLEKLSYSDGIFQFESTMILAILNAYYLDEDQKSGQAVNLIAQKWNNSLLFHFLSGLIYVKSRKNEKALQALRRSLEFDKEYTVIYSSLFYFAESYLKKLDLSTSALYYKKFLTSPGVRDFKKAANYRLYQISLLNRDSLKATEYRNQVIAAGPQFTEIDKYVFTLVKNGEIPQPGILKARLLFDGGYYRESLTQLHSVDTIKLSVEEKLEYQYRLGRAYQLLGDLETAKKSFGKMFGTSFSDHYLVANAHLQMGYLEMDNHDPALAASHFRTALKYSGEYYQASIRNEAKAGLRMVEK